MAVKPTYKELEQRVRKLEKESLEHEQLQQELMIKSRLLDAATDSIFLHDLEGNIIYVNDTACKSRGYTREELMGLKLGQLNTPEYARLIGPRIKKLLETGECMIEAEHFRKDGSIMPIEVHARIIESDGRKLILSVARDITERKRAELEYQAVIKGSMDSFVLLDNKGNFLDVNDTYCRLIGYNRDTLLNMKVQDVEAVEKPEDTALRIQRVIKSGSDSFETRHRRKDGRIVDIEVSSNYRDVGGGRFFSFCRDITERKKADEELKKSREELRSLARSLQTVREEERKRIARDVHDELGQALTVLHFDLSCIEEMLDKEQKPVIEKTRQALSLVDSTIDKVQRISWELRPTVLDDLGIAAAVEWQANEFQNRTGIKCKMTFAPDKIIMDKGLAAEIFRIFQEAMTNVARHAGATKVDVRLRRDDSVFTLLVSDNGRGITRKEIENPSSVGLIGMKERVTECKGEINITGKRGKGTTVEITVPVGSKKRGKR